MEIALFLTLIALLGALAAAFGADSRSDFDARRPNQRGSFGD